MTLSLKALGLLLHLSRCGAPRGAVGLSETLPDGRKGISSGLDELLSMGLIRRINGKTHTNQFWSAVEITEQGEKYIKNYGRRGSKRNTEPCAKKEHSIPQNGNIADTYIADIPYSSEQYGLYTNSVNQGTALKSAVQDKEEYGVMDMSLGSMPIDPDDLEYEKQKDAARKKEEKAEAKRKGYAERQRIRAGRPVEKWTPTDVVNYFAEAVKQFWRIDEVQYAQRPSFVKALTEFRATHDTTGDEEKHMLDLYIDRHKGNTKPVSSDMLFFGFIKYAPSMIEEARRFLAPENTDRADNARAKRRQQLGMDNV